MQAYDRVELPPFQQLGKAFDPRKIIRGRDRKAVPDVEVAVAILQPWVGAVLRQVSETVQGTVVEAMTERVTGSERQPVSHPLCQGTL